MKKIIRAVVIAGLCFDLMSCGALMRLGGGDEQKLDMRYAGTQRDAEFFAELVKHSSSEYLLEGLWCLFPLPLIDLPFAIAIDTILLPHDWYLYSKNKKDDEFWRAVFSSSEALPTVADCLSHISPYSRHLVSDIINADSEHMIPGASLHLCIQVVSALGKETYWMNIDKIASHKNLQPVSWIALYELVEQKKIYRSCLYDLARNPVVPTEYYPVLAGMSDLEIKSALVYNPMTPGDTLIRLKEDALEMIRIEVEKEKPDRSKILTYTNLKDRAEWSLAPKTD